jgi:hypothetical protein
MAKIDKGALPLLEQLEIRPCLKLKEVPSKFQHLENLKTLDFSKRPQNFVLGMQLDGGKDYWIVKKVPTIHFRYRIKGERYQIYKLSDSDLLECLQG